MYLSKLTLKNVRQFDQRTFEFLPGFNLLVGENGAGKTTILKGLLAALGSIERGGRRTIMEDDDIRLNARHAEVTAEVVSSNNRVEKFHFQKTLWDRSKRSSSRIERPLVLFYASNEATCSAMRVKRAKKVGDPQMNEFRRDQEYLYEMERDMERKRQKSRAGDRRFGDSGSVRGFVGKVLSSFSRDFSDFYWRFEPYDCVLVAPNDLKEGAQLDVEKQKQARTSAMRFFQETWPRLRRGPYSWPDRSKVILAPESSDAKRGEYQTPDLREIWRYWSEVGLSSETLSVLQTYSLEVKLTPRIKIRREIGPLSLSQLSDGEQRLFSLFVDIARQLSLRNPTDYFGGGEAIVMIDEIDVHLHPRWQRKIVPALEDLFNDCQFIATTHSPFVIQATNRQKITSISSATPVSIIDGGNSIEDIAENIQGVPVPQRSARAERLSEAAERYFKILMQLESRGQSAGSAELSDAEKEYRDASEPFTSDPAVHALLKVQLMEGANQ